MPKDNRNLLDVLKFDLEFLEQGGSGRLPANPGARGLFSRIPPLA
jgi:hypothetical protein